MRPYSFLISPTLRLWNERATRRFHCATAQGACLNLQSLKVRLTLQGPNHVLGLPWCKKLRFKKLAVTMVFSNKLAQRTARIYFSFLNRTLCKIHTLHKYERGITTGICGAILFLHYAMTRFLRPITMGLARSPTNSAKARIYLEMRKASMVPVFCAASPLLTAVHLFLAFHSAYLALLFYVFPSAAAYTLISIALATPL